MPGVTLTALQEGPGGDRARRRGARQHARSTTKVETFVTAYNDLVKFLERAADAAGNGDAASIGRDPLLRQLRNSLRTELLGAHGSGVLTRLAEVGVEFTRDGTLELDTDAVRRGRRTDGDDVRALFAGAGGVFPAVESVLDEYAQATGFIPAAKERLNEQITAMDDQIAAMQARLALQRDDAAA